MSSPPSTPGSGPVVLTKSRKPPRRQPLSCLPCRQHKLRCDRHIPCGTCSRYRREDVCRLHPAPPKGRSRQRPDHTQAKDASNTSERPANSFPGIGGTPQLQGNTGLSGSAPTNSEDQQLVDHVHMASAAEAMTSGFAAHSKLVPGSNGKSPEKAVLAALFPQILPLLQFPSNTLDAATLLSATSQVDQRLHWKKLLVKLLPTRTQSDILLGYFIEHINWIFQTVHIPTFRKEYARLWDGRIEDVNLIWLSLLLTILSLSALYIPINAVEFVGLPGESVRHRAHLWHHASLQALQAGNFESKPSLTQLQTFSVTQLYWYATNNIEILNSRMAQAIRHAQALGLDKDTTVSRNVEDEMRHRLWYDLVDADTFQSICLERPPLIQVRFTKVPLPLNCNDSDLGADFATPKPIDEPTSMSMNIYRAKIFQIINNVLVSDPSQLKSHDAILELDRQLLEVMQRLPWYFQLEATGEPKQFPSSYDFLIWQHHILRTCVSTQRVRMYRPFLADSNSGAWQHCITAVEDAMAVYRTLRASKSLSMQQKFFPQAYQIFSVAVTMVTMLVVERSMPNFARFKTDIDMMTADLRLLEAQVCAVPVAVNGRKVLLKMLALLEQGCSPDDAERLVPDISVIIGGENTTRAYLGRSRVAEENTTQQAQEPFHPSVTMPLQEEFHPQGAEQEPTSQASQTSGAASNARPIVQTTSEDMSFMIFPDGGDMSFDFDEFRLSDSYDLFSWDMTGLLSGAVASSNRLRDEQDIVSIMM